MIVVDPSTELLTPISKDNVVELGLIEAGGRVCYKSQFSKTKEERDNFVRRLIKRGHETPLEHCNLTVRFICARPIATEFLRHRHTSPNQESTRYCNYSNDKFGNEITVVRPLTLEPGTQLYEDWETGCKRAEESYFTMIEHGARPEVARGVLPFDLKTEIILTTNVREWRSIIKLRCSDAAHPDIQAIMRSVLETFNEYIPVPFEDLYEEFMG